jgi:flagellin-like hook-associated protein FlgL
MTTKLHELLAAEKTVLNASKILLEETEAKFGKDHFFTGMDKSLQMINESPTKDAIEKAAREVRPVTTTVDATLAYFFANWNKAEDLLFVKNKTNQTAVANIEFEGTVIASDVPVDELLGLENRLETLRRVIQRVPTLDASKSWIPALEVGDGIWKTAIAETTTKTEKEVTSAVLYPATEKHPAQIKEISKDITVGSFTLTKFSGATTTRAKAESLSRIDTLISEVKKARTRANNIDIVADTIGQKITDIILAPFLEEAPRKV